MGSLGLIFLSGWGGDGAKGEDRVVELVIDMYLGLRFVPQSISSLLFHHSLL